MECEGHTERWADLARRNGRIVHSEMQLHLIARPIGPPASEGYDPGPGYSAGTLRRDERAALLEHLRPATATPQQCWFAVWDGWGSLDNQGVQARVEHPARSYLLARGPLEAVLPSVLHEPWDQSPSLWWPEDRAWIVATEVDYAWTYVGGTSELINGIVLDERLEALPARLTDKPFYDSDVLNAALDP